MTLTKSKNLFIEVVLGHSCRAMVINNEMENFAGSEMQIYATINCTLYTFIEQIKSAVFTNFYIIVLSI
jgi:hypothetical protein